MSVIDTFILPPVLAARNQSVLQTTSPRLEAILKEGLAIHGTAYFLTLLDAWEGVPFLKDPSATLLRRRLRRDVGTIGRLIWLYREYGDRGTATLVVLLEPERASACLELSLEDPVLTFHAPIDQFAAFLAGMPRYHHLHLGGYSQGTSQRHRFRSQEERSAATQPKVTTDSRRKVATALTLRTMFHLDETAFDDLI